MCNNIWEYPLNKYIYNTPKRKWWDYACFPILPIYLYSFFKFSTFMKREYFKEIDDFIMSPYQKDYKPFLNEAPEWCLIYRGTRDGFSAPDFHRRCDKIKSTLTVVRTTDGDVFGGYARKPWSSRNTFVTDRDAFLFRFETCRKGQVGHFISPCQSKGHHALTCHEKNGPTFGSEAGNKDLYIASDSNTHRESYYNFQYYASGMKNDIKDQVSFKALEIEVFARDVFSTILSAANEIALNRLCDIGILLNYFNFIYFIIRGLWFVPLYAFIFFIHFRETDLFFLKFFTDVFFTDVFWHTINLSSTHKCSVPRNKVQKHTITFKKKQN